MSSSWKTARRDSGFGGWVLALQRYVGSWRGTRTGRLQAVSTAFRRRRRRSRPAVLRLVTHRPGNLRCSPFQRASCVFAALGPSVVVPCVGLGLSCAGTALAQPIVFVDAKATGANNGSSWTDAYADLQPAFDAAEASGGAIREIWVAYGTYLPSKRTDPDDPRSATFQLIDGVFLYGGFSTYEDSIDERDIEGNETILSGDFNGDDLPDFINYDENAYHVVLGIGIGTTTIFDGFTVTGGHAQDPALRLPSGGGMYLENAYPDIRNCTFTRNLAERPQANVAHWGGGGAALFLYQEALPLNVSRSRFTDNSSTGAGGAIRVYGSYPSGSVNFSECSFERNLGSGAFSASYGNAYTFRACTFSENSSNRSGGAIFTYSTGGELLIEQCRFELNTAPWGGAVYCNGAHSGAIRTSVFIDNGAESGEGGAVRIDGADEFEVINSYFEYNRAELGGGLYIGGPARVSDCTFKGNLAAKLGGGLFVEYGDVVELMRCYFGWNSASEGGGVSASWGLLKAIECDFVANNAVAGGAVANNDEANILIDRCKFTYNSAQVGGALSSTGAIGGTVLVSSLLAENNASAYGGGVAGGAGPLNVTNCSIAGNTAGALGAGMAVGHNSNITNSILWGNVVDPEGGAWTDEVAQVEGIEFAIIEYSDIQGWSGTYGGIGNTGLDPLFVDPADDDGPLGPLGSDFRIRSDSPCINAGLTETAYPSPWDPPPPNLDLDGKPRVLCDLVDMGAYEFGLAGDVDCDRDVDMADFSAWSACMGGPFAIASFPDCSAFDFDGDEDVDLTDFARFVRVFSPSSP